MQHHYNTIHKNAKEKEINVLLCYFKHHFHGKRLQRLDKYAIM